MDSKETMTRAIDRDHNMEDIVRAVKTLDKVVTEIKMSNNAQFNNLTEKLNSISLEPNKGSSSSKDGSKLNSNINNKLDTIAQTLNTLDKRMEHIEDRFIE